MLKTKEEDFEIAGVGVIVGRFQVSELTPGHKSLIETVINRHQKMICVVGLSEIKASKSNPLDFESRRKMLVESYPNIQIVYIKDHPDDKVWSKNLDNVISTHTPPGADVTLYGSRDCFISHYHGRFNTKELVQESFTSGTSDRINTSFNVEDSKDFRKGAIWATQNQYDSCFPTVDIAIIAEDNELIGKRILLARKPNETLFRFVGGFVDPKGTPGQGNFLETNARREVNEETHVETDEYKYVGSFLVDDWRYRGERSKIVTTLFTAKYIFGTPTPDDDIEELRWFDFNNTLSATSKLINGVVDEHKPLMITLLEKEFKN